MSAEASHKISVGSIHPTRTDRVVGAERGSSILAPTTPSPARSSDLSNASAALTALCAVAVTFGLVPCLGWLNWFSSTLCLAAFVVGIIGLVSDNDVATGRNRHPNIYLITIVGSVVLFVVSVVRCMFGGGVL